MEIIPPTNITTTVKIWKNTTTAEARLGSTPKTPEKTAKPAASADPTYPGAAGIRKVKAAKAVPKTTLIKLKSTPKAVNTVSQIAASENVARTVRANKAAVSLAGRLKTPTPSITVWVIRIKMFLNLSKTR